MSTLDRDAVLSAWSARDRQDVVIPADRSIIDTARSVREMILDRAMSGGQDEELYDACATLGRLIAQGGGSPTLAAGTIDHACEALGVRAAPWASAARAALAEGFARTLADLAAQEAMLGWEYASCSVPIGEGAVAIAAGLPSDDEELVAAWAARVSNAAARRGVRRAIVAGRDRPCAALADALSIAGIDVKLA